MIDIIHLSQYIFIRNFSGIKKELKIILIKLK